MQGKQLFEYAVIRIVPRVEREEFVNVGVILYCAGKKFLQAVYHLDEEKLRSISAEVDINELSDYLCLFERVSVGGAEAGVIGRLPVAERFRWLTATRSTMIQTSKVHTGFCIDPLEMLTKLYTELVL